MTLGSYNGFTGTERAAKQRELNRLIACGALPPPTGPCALCNAPIVVVEYHSESYARPFDWSPPGTYLLCRYCHRVQLHRRHQFPDWWAVYLSHVRRGGYSIDLRKDVIRAELNRARKEYCLGRSYKLPQLRSYPIKIGSEWFARLL